MLQLLIKQVLNKICFLIYSLCTNITLCISCLFIISTSSTKKGAKNQFRFKKFTALEKLNQKLPNVSKRETVALQHDRFLTSVGRFINFLGVFSVICNLGQPHKLVTASFSFFIRTIAAYYNSAYILI